MGYAENYASNHAAILRDLGRSQAEAKLRKGAAWAGAISDIGQTVAGIPGQLQDEKRRKQQDQIIDENLRQLMEQRQEHQWLNDALNSSVVDGKIDERRLTENLNLMGATQLVPQAVQTIRESEAALQRLKNAQQQGEMNAQTLRQMALDYFTPFAKAIAESDFDPSVVNGALKVVELQAGPKEAAQLRQQFSADPSVLKLMVQSVLVPEEEDEYTLNPGDVRFRGDQQVASNPKPEEGQTVDQMLAAALKAGDREEVNRLIKFKAQEAAATRAPQQGAQPSYQRIETVDSAGNPIIQYMTPEEVRKAGGVPTSPKTTAKASGPATVDAILGEIEVLSNKINTVSGGPLANVTGAVRRGAAAGNLDNDVSEYTALVEGFIPMVARAVGHTGVLTQQDVDSVRALFPRPGDNSTLAKNKLDRVKRIMQQMQSPDAGGPKKLTAEELIKKYGGGG